MHREPLLKRKMLISCGGWGNNKVASPVLASLVSDSPEEGLVEADNPMVDLAAVVLVDGAAVIAVTDFLLP